MDLAKIDAQDLALQLQEELQEVLRIVKEKGWQYFRMPFILAAGAVGASYLLLYSATVDRLDKVQKDLSAEQAKAAYAGEFQKLKEKLNLYYAKLPRPEQKEGWLFNTILDSGGRIGIQFDAIGSQSASDMEQYWLLSIPVNGKGTSAQIGQWMEVLENNAEQLFVTSLSIRKSERPDAGWGVIEFQAEVGTVVPKKVQRI